MNMNRQKIVLSLVVLVLISGCVGIPDVFGRDVISIQQSVVENGVRDVLVIKDIQTIPKSPLLPNQQIVLSFIVENRDKLKSSLAVVDLFNAPTMRSVAGEPCNLYASGTGSALRIEEIPGTGDTLPSRQIIVISELPSGTSNICIFCSGYSGACLPAGTCTDTGTCPADSSFQPCSQQTIGTPGLHRYCIPDQCGAGGCKILPGEEKPVNFVMMTPTEGDIKNIKTETKLNFKTTYNFDGSLSYIVPAVNTEEILKRQRSGDKTNLFTTKSHSSGPVQIDVELQGAPYILANYEAVLLFKIKNRGSGTLVKSQIDASAMRILFPPEFVVTPNEKFTCAPSSGGTECTNSVANGVIPLYRDESRSSLRFSVKLREPLLEPFRSYPITADVKYFYELRNSVDLTINPFQNV